MLETRIHLIVLDVLATLVRTIEAPIDAGSIQNARTALVEGRRSQVIRSLLEDDAVTSDAGDAHSLIPAASS